MIHEFGFKPWPMTVKLKFIRESARAVYNFYYMEQFLSFSLHETPNSRTVLNDPWLNNPNYLKRNPLKLLYVNQIVTNYPYY